MSDEETYLNPPASGGGFRIGPATPGGFPTASAEPHGAPVATAALSKAVSRAQHRGGHRFKALASGNQRRGVMNGAERAYAAFLEQQRLAGEIRFWDYERQRTIVTHPAEGVGVNYTPDFVVILADGTIAYDDVKGTGVDNDASLVRAKAAAEICWYFRYRIVKKQTKAQGGGWKVTEL